jgi:hypothetical protein
MQAVTAATVVALFEWYFLSPDDKKQALKIVEKHHHVLYSTVLNQYIDVVGPCLMIFEDDKGWIWYNLQLNKIHLANKSDVIDQMHKSGIRIGPFKIS